MVGVCGMYVGEERFKVPESVCGKLGGNRPLGKHRHRWEGNIKMNLQVIKWCGIK
jgi:hypothetical protein